MDLNLYLSIALLILGFVLFKLSDSHVKELIRNMRKANEHITDMNGLYWIICSLFSMLFMGFAAMNILIYII